MKAHSKQSLAILAVALGAMPFLAASLTPAADPEAAGVQAPPSLCAAVPTPMPLAERTRGTPRGIADGTAPAHGTALPALLGTLGLMIVETQLSQAPVLGRFEPVIHTAVAGSDLALEVCRDSIAGEVTVASGASLRFVIGDFNADGATDVALLGPDGHGWSVDLGAPHQETAGPAAPATPDEARRPGARTLTPGAAPRLAGARSARGALPAPG